MKRKYLLLCSFAFLFFVNGYSQSNDSIAKLKVSGYVDAYYAYYTDSVGVSNFQQFPSVSPRSNQFGLNTAMLTFQYDAEKVRALATFHYGDIAKSTWSPTLNQIMEAHAGVRLSKKLWLDAGFFRTHFGTEGLLPKENFTSSVSVNTYYEPYFEEGLRLNYNPNDKLSIGFYVLNGYNIFEDNNNKKSIALNVTYLLGDKGNIGYTNYVGDDAPVNDVVSRMRIHQNIFFNYQFNKLKLQTGVDYCVQQHSSLAGADKSATMYSGVLSFKYQFRPAFALYTRGELFQDRDGIMSGVITDKNNARTGYKLWGLTIGAEYKPTENSYIRLEGRQLQMDKEQEIFYSKNKFSSMRMEVMVNFGISF